VGVRGRVAGMGKKKIAINFSAVKPKGKIQLGRPKNRWEDNTKIDLRERWWEGVYWTDTAQDRNKWRALLKMVLKLRVP